MSDTKEASPANDLPTVMKHRHCEACGVVVYRTHVYLCRKCYEQSDACVTALERAQTPRERVNVQGRTIGEIRQELGGLREQHEKRLHELEILARRMEDALIRASVGGKP